MESGSMYGRTGLLMSKQKQAGRQALSQSFCGAVEEGSDYYVSARQGD
jgi:hypothetical protein